MHVEFVSESNVFKYGGLNSHLIPWGPCLLLPIRGSSVPGKRRFTPINGDLEGVVSPLDWITASAYACCIFLLVLLLTCSDMMLLPIACFVFSTLCGESISLIICRAVGGEIVPWSSSVFRVMVSASCSNVRSRENTSSFDTVAAWGVLCAAWGVR